MYLVNEDIRERDETLALLVAGGNDIVSTSVRPFSPYRK